jgi:hypothetical protein
MSQESCTDYFDNNVPNACVPQAGPIKIGETCIANGQCTSSYCAIPTGTQCGKCQAQPKVGDSCADLDCGFNGLVCSSATQTCIQPATDGGSCTDVNGCVAGEDCLGLDAGGNPGNCMPKVIRAGFTCDPRRLTAPSCYSRLGLFCADKYCHHTEVVDAGSDCGDVDAGLAACPTGESSCIVSDQIVCSSGDACIEGSTNAATCVSSVNAGQTCDTVAGPSCAPGNGTCLVSGTSTQGICALPSSSACP